MLTLTVSQSCKDEIPPSDESANVKSSVTLTNPTIESISEYMTFNGVTQFLKRDNIRATTTGYVAVLNFNAGNRIADGSVFCMIATKEQKALRTLSETDTLLQKFQTPQAVLSNSSGIISTISILTGDYVNEGDVIATVIEPSSLVLNLNVPYEFNKLIRTGKSCEIFLPDGSTIDEVISNSLPSVDPKTLSQVFLIRLGNTSLPENLTVTVKVRVEDKVNVLSLPLKAVQTDEEQKEFWVMKVIDDSIAVKVPVETGAQNDSVIQIISEEISPEDKIILEGAYELADSSLVKSAAE